MEAFAAVRALQFARELEISKAVLEGDSELIINALKDDGSSLTTRDLILQDTDFISAFFTQLRYSHIMREGNMAAYNLARYSRNVSDFVVWMEDAPPYIHNVGEFHHFILIIFQS